MRLYVVNNCHSPVGFHNPGGCPFSATKNPRYDMEPIACGHPQFGDYGRGFSDGGAKIETDDRGRVVPPHWCPLKNEEGPHLVALEGQVSPAEQGMAAHMRDIREGLKWVAQTLHQAHHEGPIEECPKGTCDHAMKLLGRKR